ncbi:MAG: hypothetical protein ABR501_08775 [Pyrinomonadaceae bacterium]
MAKDLMKALLLSLPISLVIAAGYALYRTADGSIDSIGSGARTGGLAASLSVGGLVKALIVSEIILSLVIFSLLRRRQKRLPI